MGVTLECWRIRIGCYLPYYHKPKFKTKELTTSASMFSRQLQIWLILNLFMWLNGGTANSFIGITDTGNYRFHNQPIPTSGNTNMDTCINTPFIPRLLEMCSDVEKNPGPNRRSEESQDKQANPNRLFSEFTLANMDELQNSLKVSRESNDTLSKLKTHVEEAGYTLRGVTPADGNCFFHAILDQLQRVNDKNTDDPTQLRQRVVEYLCDTRSLMDKTDKFAFVSGYETWDDYIQAMAKSGTWVDHLVVMTTSEILNRQIWIFTSYRDGEHIRNRFIRIGNQSDPFCHPLVVALYDEMHYQSLDTRGPVTTIIEGINQKTKASTDLDITVPLDSTNDAFLRTTAHQMYEDCDRQNDERKTTSERTDVLVGGSVYNSNIAQTVYGGMGNTYIYQGSTKTKGVPGAGLVDLLIEDTQATFFETSVYNQVESKLRTHGHVMICGTSGEGKTSIALMLGDQYRRKAYELHFVKDPLAFSTDISINRKTICIFDDIFGTQRMTYDISKLKEIFLYVDKRLEKEKRMSKQHAKLNDEESDDSQELGELNFMVVFTSKSYNLTKGMSILPEYKLFMNGATVDITTSNKYSQSEMENIFINHKKNHNVSKHLPIEAICNLETTMFGFPLSCYIYFKYLYSEGLDVLEFFRKPLAYLERELASIMTSQKEESAALLIMMLSENGLNRLHLENESFDSVFDKKVKTVMDLIPSPSRHAIAKAVKTFQGTFFTKGDVMYFSHTAIADACAFVIFESYPAFLLQNCSITFLYERVSAELGDSTERDDEKNILYIGIAYSEIVVGRLADTIEKGSYSMTISHPILKNECVVDSLFNKLNLRHDVNSQRMSEIVDLHSKENNKCFLYWAVHAKSLYLIKKILSIENEFSLKEVCEAFEACVVCGNIPVMELLFSNFPDDIPQSLVSNAVRIAASKGHGEMFHVLQSKLKNAAPSLNSYDPVGLNLLQRACIGGNIDITKHVLSSFDIDSRTSSGHTPVMLAVINDTIKVVDFLIGEGANPTLNDNGKNTALHLACFRGSTTIVDRLLQFFDVNIRGEHGKTPVMYAVLNGNSELFKLLIAKGADVTLTENDGNTVLHLACREGHVSIVKHLLSKEMIDINSRGSLGETPVMTAAFSGKQEVFDLLVENGADLTLTNKAGNNVLHYACLGGKTSIVKHLLPLFDINSRGRYEYTPLICAANSGIKEIFDLLLKRGADHKLTGTDGTTVLHSACLGGNVAIVKQLLPVFNINIRGLCGSTPVMIAAFKGKKEVFDLLVAERSDLTLTDNVGATVLHKACQGGNTLIVQYLLKLFDINTRGENGWTPIMTAVNNGKNEVFDLLVNNKANLIVADNFGYNVLHRACAVGNITIAKHLLPSFDINCRGQHCTTPVLLAASIGNLELFVLLVQKGADLKLADNFGNTVLHWACLGGNVSIVNYLISSSNINFRGQDGLTPVMMAVSRGWKDIFDLLVTREADLTLTDNIGATVLHRACEEGNTSIVNYLLSLSDINMNSRDHHGSTPVFYACNAGKTDILGMLKAEGADLTLTDNNGLNVLHHACRGGNVSIANQLLPLFDINIRGKYGWTPIMYAAIKGKKEVFDLLEAKGADLTLIDRFGDTLLHKACQGGNVSIVKYLLPSFDINIRGYDGWTPVFYAVKGGIQEVFDLLVSSGADLNITDCFGATVLHRACEEGSISIVKRLLPLFDINMPGHNDWTPVFYAANSGWWELFDLLVNKGADLRLTALDDSVLHIACQGGNTVIVQYLMRLFSDINIRGQNDVTPLFYAAHNGKKDIFDLLMVKGADITLTDKAGSNILHRACREGNISMVNHLLPFFDINIRGANGWTPVMYAAFVGKKEVFDLLVAKGADLTLTDNNEESVMTRACQGGNTSIVKHLLSSFDVNSQGQYGTTLSMYAAIYGKKEVFDLLMTNGCDITLTDMWGNNVLQRVCLGGSSSMVEYLTSFFDINNPRGDGWTAVHNAAFCDGKEMFDILVRNGSNVTLKTSDNRTILHLACSRGNIDTVKSTLSYFDVDVKDDNGLTPLMMAVYEGHTDVVDLLVSNKADINLVDGDGDSLLHLACESGNLAMVKHVFPFVNINLRDKLGWTPLMQSAVRGHIAVFQYLVEQGADLTLVDNVGDGVLNLAYRGGSMEIIRQLTPADKEIQTVDRWTDLMYDVSFGHWGVLKNLQVTSPELRQRDGFGDTLLHLASRSGNVQCVEYLLPYLHIDILGRYDWTPVMIAALCGHLEVCQYLMSHQADLSLVSDTGEDVLSLACRGKIVHVIAELLSRDEFITRKVLVSLNGNTLLHLGCMGGNVENVEHLLPDFNINVRGRYGWTPVMIAAMCGHMDVLQCLISHEADLSLV